MISNGSFDFLVFRAFGFSYELFLFTTIIQERNLMGVKYKMVKTLQFLGLILLGLRVEKSGKSVKTLNVVIRCYFVTLSLILRVVSQYSGVSYY